MLLLLQDVKGEGRWARQTHFSASHLRLNLPGPFCRWGRNTKPRDLPKFPFHLRDAELSSVPAGALTTPKEQPIIIIVITGTDC